MTAQLARAPSMTLRIATVTDQPAIACMHARCSWTSRQYRWRAALATIPRTYLQDALRRRPGHLCVLALEGDDVVGMASAVEEDDRAWQLGVLVRDDRQRLGIGTGLIAELITRVRASGGRTLVAETAPDRLALLQRLGRAGELSVARTVDGLRAVVSLSGGTTS
jgi:ribosomal protein S18 acetylase RimI-like enzyme